MNTSQVWGVGLVAKLNYDVNGKNLNLNPLHTSKSGGWGGWRMVRVCSPSAEEGKSGGSLMHIDQSA